MTENTSYISSDEVKKIAAIELNTCLSAKTTILEEHSASFRWLMASMLAINLGGLATVANKSELFGDYRLISGISFFIGILASLAIAWLGQISGRKMLEPLGKLIGFWTVTAHSGDFQEMLHQSLVEDVQKSMKFSRIARIPGWLSVICFTIGCAGTVFVKEEVESRHELTMPNQTDKKLPDDRR